MNTGWTLCCYTIWRGCCYTCLHRQELNLIDLHLILWETRMKPAKAKIISIAYSREISVQCTDDKKMFIVRILHHQPTSTYRGNFFYCIMYTLFCMHTVFACFDYFFITVFCKCCVWINRTPHSILMAVYDFFICETHRSAQPWHQCPGTVSFSAVLACISFFWSPTSV